MYKRPRIGCKDIWNAFMCEGARYSINDIPKCPTTSNSIPKRLILWDEAKALYKREILHGNEDFLCDVFVCFYMDDYKFDGKDGVWNNPEKALKILRHFSGVITPDFSTYQDFPEPLKIYNTFRMRVWGYWIGKQGIQVINNIRWGTPESWKYCWDGIPKNSIVAIGTVGGNPKKLVDRKRFNEGFYEMIRVLNPRAIVVYGSSNYEVFESARNMGIEIYTYPSRTDTAFKRRKDDEQT